MLWKWMLGCWRACFCFCFVFFRRGPSACGDYPSVFPGQRGGCVRAGRWLDLHELQTAGHDRCGGHGTTSGGEWVDCLDVSHKMWGKIGEIWGNAATDRGRDGLQWYCQIVCVLSTLYSDIEMWSVVWIMAYAKDSSCLQRHFARLCRTVTANNWMN